MSQVDRLLGELKTFDAAEDAQVQRLKDQLQEQVCCKMLQRVAACCSVQCLKDQLQELMCEKKKTSIDIPSQSFSCEYPLGRL